MVEHNGPQGQSHIRRINLGISECLDDRIGHGSGKEVRTEGNIDCDMQTAFCTN